MNRFVYEVSEWLFAKPKHLFNQADVILYHPGHFPELNEQLVHHWRRMGEGTILIPAVHNRFLQADEYEFHKQILVEQGIPHEKVEAVRGEFGQVRDVVRAAFQLLAEREVRRVLLAGKAFFCRRFLLLASYYALPSMEIDILPLNDHRGITSDSWFLSEAGIQRVLKEVEACAALLLQWNKERAGKFSPNICQAHSKKGGGNPDERTGIDRDCGPGNFASDL
jgi:hypothetical protein